MITRIYQDIQTCFAQQSNVNKQMPGQCPVGLMGAERTEIPLKEKELGWQLRNLKTANARTVPSGINGSGADRNSTEREGTGRAFAELKIGGKNGIS